MTQTMFVYRCGECGEVFYTRHLTGETRGCINCEKPALRIVGDAEVDVIVEYWSEVD